MMARPALAVKNHRYSVSELFRLRESVQVVNCVISRINSHPDIAGIFRLPYEAFRNPNSFACTTKMIPIISNKLNIPQGVRRQLGNSSEQSEYHNKSEPCAKADFQQVQWNLSRRDGSDRSSQPYSAPSGLVAQQSENFQRFYRAVVSPTHVRVTAGGRIVPNNRAIPPAFEWDAEKKQFEPAESSHQESNIAQPYYWHQSNAAPVFQSLNTGNLMPPYLLRPINHNFIAPLAPQQAPGAYIVAGEQKALEAEEESKLNRERGAGLASVKISPPTQFDQTRPFLLNGQLVYPAPQGYQTPASSLPIPFAILGSSCITGSVPSSSGFLPAHMNLPVTSMHPPFLFPGQQFPMSFQHFPQQLSHTLPNNSPLGLISVADLTKNQLQELRHFLRTIDHQLTNNKHQINESVMLTQRAAVETQINNMEGMLNVQLMAEKNQQDRARGEIASRKGEQKTNSSTESSFASTIASSVSTSVPRVEHSASIASSKLDIQKSQIARLEDARVAPLANDGKHRVASHSISRLSAAAAMAPPFQPRSQAATQSLNGAIIQTCWNTSAESPDHLSTEASLAATGLHGDQPIGANIGFSRAHTILESSGQDTFDVQGLGVALSNNFQSQTAALASMSVHAQAVPYLVGTLPSGLKPSEATPSDLTYSRPLTEEELRARYLYWGKTPRLVQSGLPKFDGKDFYPPSPVKENAQSATPNSSQDVRPLLPDFSNLFTEPGYPSWKAPAPLCPVTSVSHLFATTQRQSPTSEFHSSHDQPRESNGESGLYQPTTPTNRKTTEGELDFSGLFLERGTPGFSSPSPPPPGPFFLDSDSGERKHHNCPTRHGETSETSTVEIHLSPQQKGKANADNSFVERLANTNSERQTSFLQNLLRNNATMSGPALLGGVTTATAQGHLPQYRGTAAASLSPAMLNMTVFECDSDQKLSKIEQPRVANGSTINFKHTSLISENRPLSHAIPIVRPIADNMNAEGYMRYLTLKTEDDKQTKDHGWNADRAGTGPVMGSNW